MGAGAELPIVAVMAERTDFGSKVEPVERSPAGCAAYRIAGAYRRHARIESQHRRCAPLIPKLDGGAQADTAAAQTRRRIIGREPMVLHVEAAVDRRRQDSGLEPPAGQDCSRQHAASDADVAERPRGVAILAAAKHGLEGE